MELTDGSLTLRPPAAADAESVAAAVQASLPQLLPWMVWASADYDAATAMQWITGETGDPHRFVMIDLDGEHVGSCGLNRVDELNQSANLGYWLRTDRTGRGYATAATRLLARYGLEQVGLHRLEIVLSTRNEPSRRVAERSGAHYEGIARQRLMLRGEAHDAHVFSFVSGDSIPDPIG